MPFDELDSDDPMEIVGHAIPDVDEREMVLAVIDEYIRMGYGREDLWRLFSDPFYRMTHAVLIRRGRDFVVAAIDEALAHWAPGPVDRPEGCPPA